MIPDFRDEHQPSDHRRVIAVGEGERGTPALGWIEPLTHGGWVRPVITRGGMHLRFAMPSVKTGMTEVGEGRGEELLAMQSEIDGDTVNFKCHPYRFGIESGGKPFTYRPDLAIIYRGGRLEIVEVKRTPDDLDREERDRLGRVREFVRLCGWTFSIRYLDEIRGSKHREHNVAHIFGRRAMELTGEEWGIAKSMRLSMREIAWADAVASLSPSDLRRGNAAVERLLAAGWFTTDLDAHLNRDSILKPTRAVPQRPLPGFEGNFA